MQFPNPKLNDRFRALTVGRIAVAVLGAAVLATGAVGATPESSGVTTTHPRSGPASATSSEYCGWVIAPTQPVCSMK